MTAPAACESAPAMPITLGATRLSICFALEMSPRKQVNADGCCGFNIRCVAWAFPPRVSRCGVVLVAVPTDFPSQIPNNSARFSSGVYANTVARGSVLTKQRKCDTSTCVFQ